MKMSRGLTRVVSPLLFLPLLLILADCELF